MSPTRIQERSGVGAIKRACASARVYGWMMTSVPFEAENVPGPGVKFTVWHTSGSPAGNAAGTQSLTPTRLFWFTTSGIPMIVGKA